ncbi:MAG: cardiolipin synthase ClsB [Clostridia bacterium]
MQYVAGNRFTLLKNGEQYFPALVAALDTAQAEVFVETYIFADDETGSLVADAIARAAARGVKAHLLIDGFGARDFPVRFRRSIESAGGRVLVFRRNVRPMLRRTRLRRMHRKIAVIDGRIAFVGGINVVDDYETPFDDPRVTPPRHDYAVKIEGPLAAEVRGTAARLWRKVSWARLRRRGELESAPPAPAAAGTQRGALVIRDSMRHRRDIEEAYLAQIAAARVEVIIACAYFFPGRRFRRALMEAAARKVRVRLLLQGKIEYPFVHYASRGLYGALLDAGIEIHEYNAALLHAKVAIFDRRCACVGSSNIDVFSLLLAREANVFIDDVAFAAELRASVEHAMRADAAPLAPREWSRQPLWRRLLIWTTYGLARFVMSFYGLDRY